MGMAASQSRFLSLTARKSNTEFQGQQVNQQRTILSNQTANLYNQMMSLEVPTPPSSETYYKTTYSFTNDANTDDTNTYKFIEYSQVNKTVKVSYDQEVSVMQQAGKQLQYNSDTKKFELNGKEVEVEDINYDKAQKAILNTKSNEGNWGAYIKDGAYDSSKKLYQVKYTNDDGDAEIYYISSKTYDDLQKDSKKAESVWKIGETKISKEAELSDVKFNKDQSSGRLSGITFAKNSLNLAQNHEFKLDITKVKDEEGYEEAMLDYKYKQAQYDQEYERINNETKRIQAKDKNLELKLKQLDTEQNAIQTELEAVTKVIDKNIEDTFKTFA